MKKLALILLIVVLCTSVYASLDLTKKTYGPDQNFEGYISINKSEVDLNEIISGIVEDCGSYSEKETTLFQILKNSSKYAGDLYTYTTTGSGSTSTTLSGEKEYAFQIDETLKNFSFDISGNSGKIKIDVGLDGYDYEYPGEFKAWNYPTQSLDYKSSYSTYPPNYNNVELANPKVQKCSNFQIEFTELLNEIPIRINSVAKRVSSGGELKAKVGSQSCDFGEVNNYWTTLHCNLNLDVSEEESPTNVTVCIYTSSDSSEGNFRLPEVPPSKKYYFTSINLPIYEDYASDFSTSSNSLKKEINDYYNNNCDGVCVIPLRLYGESSFTINPLLTSFDGGSSNLIYNLDLDVEKYNVTEKDIDLNYFNDLKTPDSGELCELKVEFLGKTYKNYFNITDAPTPRIRLGSQYTAKNIPVTFDGSSSTGDISYWKWDFGDNTTSSGKIVQHSYKSEGNFTVTLTITDSRDVKSSTKTIVNVVSLEKVLEKEIPDKVAELNTSLNIFKSLTGIRKEFYNNMDYNSKMLSSAKGLAEIYSDYTSTKNSNEIDKDKEYKIIFEELNKISEITPKKLTLLDSSTHINFTPSSVNEVPTFSKIVGLTNTNEAKAKIYTYNQKEVKGTYNYNSIRVDYLSGSDNYIYVDKEFKSKGGELIDNTGNYNNLTIFSTGCSFEGLNKVIYCPSVNSNFNLKYVVLSEDITLTSGFIIPNSIYDESEITYRFDCEGECDYSYCGDKKCFRDSFLGIDEVDKENAYYCPQDCGFNIPWGWYIALIVVMLFGVFWINFYRGPGNFFDTTNAISYKLLHRKLFLIKKDRIILKSYILRALGDRFNEGEIRRALRRKGWTKKQLDFIFNELKGTKKTLSKGL